MSDRIAVCKSCNAPIIWRNHVDSQRAAPLDAEPVAHGTWRVVGPDHYAYAGEPDEPRYTAHFATCPNAKEHRSDPHH